MYKLQLNYNLKLSSYLLRNTKLLICLTTFEQNQQLLIFSSVKHTLFFTNTSLSSPKPFFKRNSVKPSSILQAQNLVRSWKLEVGSQKLEVRSWNSLLGFRTLYQKYIYAATPHLNNQLMQLSFWNMKYCLRLCHGNTI